jgi:predicted ATPase
MNAEGGSSSFAFTTRMAHSELASAIRLVRGARRPRTDGLYLLDEPEAALSTQNCLTALRRIHELVQDGSQLIIATHSPIILAYPRATIYHCRERGLEQVEYEEAEPVRLTRSFLEARDRFLAELLRD